MPLVGHLKQCEQQVVAGDTKGMYNPEPLERFSKYKRKIARLYNTTLSL
jgi:hypothetical protein